MKAFASNRHWHIVGDLIPQVHDQLRISLHRYNNQDWYVAWEEKSNKTFRVPIQTGKVLDLIDGRSSVSKVWEKSRELFPDDPPSQDQILSLLTQLFDANAIKFNGYANAREIEEKIRSADSLSAKAIAKNPLSIKIPLYNPNALLDGLERYLRILRVEHVAKAAIFAAIFVGISTAIFYFNELSEHFSARISSVPGLLSLAILYPIIKFIHELGHGIVAKRYGLPVNELGVIFFTIYPMPYVDVSSASTLSSKYRRAWVSAAGILTELLLMSFAVVLWAVAEGGVWRNICADIVLLTGVSTVIANANPLMKFDGYFVLTDIIEMPNLALRSERFWKNRVFKPLIWANNAEHDHERGPERAALIAYAPLSWTYRIIVIAAFALMFVRDYGVIGGAIALVMVAMLAKPAGSGLYYLFSSQELTGRRGIAMWRVTALVLGTTAFLAFVPVPSSTVAEGVTWLPDDAYVRAEVPGHVLNQKIPAGSFVNVGDQLFEVTNNELRVTYELMESKVLAARARLSGATFSDQAVVRVLQHELALEEAKWARARQDVENLSVRAKVSGRLAVQRAADLAGKYARKGDILGYVLPETSSQIRVLVDQSDIALVRSGVISVRVRLAGAPMTSQSARVTAIIPLSTDELPSNVLGPEGGGSQAMSPKQADRQPRSLARNYVVDIETLGAPLAARFGEHAYVKFDLPWEPIGVQVFRRFRQTFLAELGV